MDLRNRPQVLVTVGEPVKLNYRSETADTKRVMAAISALLPVEANTVRIPSADELEKTYPPGHKVGQQTPGHRGVSERQEEL